MIKKIIGQLYLAGLLITHFTALSQDLQFDRRTVNEIVSFEKGQSGIVIDSIESFGILRNPHIDINTLDKTEAYIFKRENDSFVPQLHVWYHFDIKTKQIKGIRYNWGLYNPSFNPTKERNKLELLIKREKEFKNKYKSLRQELTDLFGDPIKSNTLADNKRSLIEETFWINSDKIIGLSIRFDRQIVEIPGAGIISDFHIEIMTTFK